MSVKRFYVGSWLYPPHSRRGLRPSQIPNGLAAAAAKLTPADRAALEFAAERIRAFHEKQLQPSSSGLPGLKLLTRPVHRAGLYAPGGRAAYPSTVLMTVIPARIAKVPEVVLATPPRADGTVPSAILAAAHIAGVDAVYRGRRPHATPAPPHGTAPIPPLSPPPSHPPPPRPPTP